MPFNVIHADFNEDDDFFESGQITPTPANPRGLSSNNELTPDTSGEATPKANKENKLNLGEANKKLEQNSTPDVFSRSQENIQEPADMNNNVKYEEIFKYLSTTDWGHIIKKVNIDKFIADNPQVTNLGIKEAIFTTLITPSRGKWERAAGDSEKSDLIIKQLLKISPSLKNYHSDLMKDKQTTQESVNNNCFKKFKDDCDKNFPSDENK